MSGFAMRGHQINDFVAQRHRDHGAVFSCLEKYINQRKVGRRGHCEKLPR